jgi:DNA polymerase III subunit delta'
VEESVKIIMDSIIGHNNIKKYFLEGISTGSLSHAHLFVGEDGIGKSLLARYFAVKLLNKPEIKQYVDILEFRSPKNKKSIGVDEIRGIIEEISKKPYEGDKKIIIIYEGDAITPQAQNAFLKTVEEPPAGVYIFILCENSDVILDTIKSRCQIHKLNRLSHEEIKSYLKERYPYQSQKELDTALAFSSGIPGRADKFIEDETFKEIRDFAAKLLLNINTLTDIEILKYSEFLYKKRDISEEIFTVFLSFIRDIMIYKDVSEEDVILNKDKIKDIKEASNLLSYNKLEAIINIINSTRENINSNVNAALTFDVMLLKILDA